MFRTQCAAIVLSAIAMAPLLAQQRYNQYDSAEIKVPYPDNWNRTMLSAGLRVAFVNESERSFVVSRTRVGFSPRYNEAFAEIEEKFVRDEMAGATQLTRTTLMHPVHGQVLQIDFTLPGVTGRNPRPLRLRHVSIPAGTFIYRITCVAREDEFKTKYDAIFKYMIERLVLTPPPS
jgi:hypothetical protein